MPAAASNNEFTLPDAPADSISAVRFSPSAPDQLLVSSWDQSLRLYSVNVGHQNNPSAELIAKFDHPAVVFDVAWGTDEIAYTACLDQRVRVVNLKSQEMSVLGKHEGAVRCIAYSRQMKLLFTGSWDETLRVWDPSASNPLLYTIKAAGKIHSMDLQNNHLVIVQDARKIAILNIKNLSSVSTLDNPTITRESNLKYMTRIIRGMTSGEGFVSGSIEGRIAVDFFNDTSSSGNGKYSFKCHRNNVEGQDVVYPVNALAFNPKYSTFASGGSDKHVALWDADAKRRLKHYGPYPQSISALDFNASGSILAIACSYNFEKGVEGMPSKMEDQPCLILRYVEGECIPKAKK